MHQNRIRTYQKTDVLTSDPKNIVLMCYELAINHLKKAKTQYEHKEFEAKAKSLQTALAVIHELRQGLDFKLGGEVAKNLDALYHYMTNRLTTGDLKKDLKAFDEITDMLEELLSAWREIFTPAPGDTVAPAPFAQRGKYGNQSLVQEEWKGIRAHG